MSVSDLSQAVFLLFTMVMTLYICILALGFIIIIIHERANDLEMHVKALRAENERMKAGIGVPPTR